MKAGMLLIVATMAATLFPMADHAASSDQTLSEADAASINKTVESIRKAIVSGKVSAVLEYISRSHGLSCTDTEYSYVEAAEMLEDQRSPFYQGLFDSAGFRKECGDGYPADYPAISEKEFYASASHEAQIELLDQNWVKITIRSPVRSRYERWLYLHREGSAWKVAGGSFIIGNCTCG